MQWGICPDLGLPILAVVMKSLAKYIYGEDSRQSLNVCRYLLKTSKPECVFSFHQCGGGSTVVFLFTFVVPKHSQDFYKFSVKSEIWCEIQPEKGERVRVNQPLAIIHTCSKNIWAP